jgi:sulfide:quinone oxidoreductase
LSQHHDIVIVGGGTAGITVAARLRDAMPERTVALIEPSEQHFYQPIWTLVGAGVFDRAGSVRATADYIPPGVRWVKDRATAFNPDRNAVETASNGTLTYEVLVVAPGIQLNWDAIDGLREAVGRDGVCSNYAWETVESTWRSLQATTEGNAIFTFPSTSIKCGGAPQKIMWLAEDHFRRRGIRDRVNVVFASAGAGIFGVPRYAEPLGRMVEERGIETRFRTDLVALRPGSREAIFRHLDTGEETSLRYSMIHVTPPQAPPTFVAQSPLADAGGWVDVDRHTTQHVRYPNVFSLGDASSLPCSKTGAAVRKQAPVTVANIAAFLRGDALPGHYDGYSSCPIVTGYGRLMLAEFGYDGTIMETFPFPQNRERASMYALKAYVLPEMYWHGMLRGRA